MKLNNKGYMLVEIILASVIAMVIVYFITDLTIKLKNKNDDLLVRTLVSTDQAIIYNTIMEDLYEDYGGFSCSNIDISDNTFKYKEFTNIVSEYATLDYNSARDCSYTSSEITVNIGINVNQLPDEDFNVLISYQLPS